MRRQSGDLAALEELVNKMPENCARIAATLTVWIGQIEVSKEIAEQAIEIARFHLSEAIRISDNGCTDPVTEAAIRTTEWLAKHFWKGERFALPDLYNSGGPLRKYPHAFRKKVLDRLVEHKWLEKDDSGEKVQSKFGQERRRDNIYRLRFGRTNELDFVEAEFPSQPQPTTEHVKDVKAVKDNDDATLDEILAGL